MVWGCSGYGGILTCVIIEHAVGGVAEGRYGGGGVVWGCSGYGGTG